MSTPDLIIFQVVEVDLSEERRMVEDIHSYACKGPPPPPPPETERKSAPVINNNNNNNPPTIIKNPPPKRKRGRPQRLSAVDLPLIEVQNNIIQVLAEKINTRSDQVEKMIRSHSAEMEFMSEALSSVHRHVLDLKKDNQQLRTENAALRRKMSELEFRANKQEKFSRGFNLRLYGVAENPSENLRAKVREVCRSLVPEDDEVATAVDTARRLGRLKAGENTRVTPRPIIIRFTSAAARNLTWERAKKSLFLRSQGFRFKEDGVARNKAARHRLWSAVEKEPEEDVPNLNICEEEVPGDQQRNTSLDQEEPEPDLLTGIPPAGEDSEQIDQPLSQRDQPLSQRDQPLSQDCPAAGTLDQDRSRTELTPLTCRACGKACPDPGSLLAHAADHKGDDQNICSFCGKRFQSFGVLRRHHRVHTGQKRFVCDLCGKAFVAKHSLSDHSRVHTGERPFACETCGRAFVRKENMMVHRRSHSGVRSYFCDVCGKAFLRVDTLAAHRRIHTGERRFSCETCGKRFITSSSCKIHMRSHGDVQMEKNGRRADGGAAERRFPCELCDKRFSYKCNMLIHMRVHTGEKPFSCHVCGRSFSQKGSLKCHSRTHCGPEASTCDTCGKSCSNRGALMLHLKVHRDRRLEERLENVQSLEHVSNNSFNV
ncbi:zinc finger protein 2-like [Kryptolebias marmoratus]|uniref:zinc finger protein 2-like n=1 Tax=Kryptolebias marmoratus TaxID=37003 RepID=UPI000D530C16|nr:zinc finger protein 2-like [Kryptolebias marmoratus]